MRSILIYTERKKVRQLFWLYSPLTTLNKLLYVAEETEHLMQMSKQYSNATRIRKICKTLNNFLNIFFFEYYVN